MQPIAASIAPSSRLDGTTEPLPEPADGFEALLAGLVAAPAPAPDAASKSGSPTLAPATTQNPGDSADAPLEGDTITSGAARPSGAPLPADARLPAAGTATAPAPAPGAATAGMPGAAPTEPRAGPGEPDAPPQGAMDGKSATAANQGALAAGLAKARATGRADMPATTGRSEGRQAGPQPAAGRPTSGGAAARLERPATAHDPLAAPTHPQSGHPAASAAGVTARSLLPIYAMATMPGDLGGGDPRSSVGELADGSLLRGLAIPTPIAGEPAASPTGVPTATAVQPTRQLAAAIDRAVAGEIRQLTIQLSPRELGAIDIALSFDEERRLSVSILAERPETLELLKAESRQLERLLGRQGIDLADAGVELGLMSQERGGNGDADASTGRQVLVALGELAGEAEPSPDDAADLSIVGAAAALGAERRLNLSI